MLKVKSSVRPKGVVILAAIANVAGTLPHDVTVTSFTDGKHMDGSKHYSGDAVDVRTKNFRTWAEKRDFVDAVLERLGPGYQGFLESVGQLGEHAHFEFDPE